MKKFSLLTMLILFAIALSACGDNNVNEENLNRSNTIEAAELTNREKGILSTTSAQSFVFDFNIDHEYKEVSIWIEKYEFGKVVDEQIGYTTTEVSDNGSIFFTTSKSNPSLNQISFNMGIHSNGITGSSSSIPDIISDKSTEGMSTVWGNINEPMEITDGELVLGSICYAWGENSMSSLTSEFYKDIEGRIHEIESYEVVYLLKSKFMK